MKNYPLLENIIAYESGELPQEDFLPFFAELVRSGKAWILQGCYGRQAQNLIENGYISREGKILKDIESE